MIRTLTPPISEMNDPSGRCRRTGGRRLAFSRTRNCALVAATSRRKSPASKPRSIRTSIVSSSRCSSLRAQSSSPSAVVPNTAPISARVPVSASVISWMTGYPVSPREAFIFPSQPRFRAVSGTFSDLQPSKATVRYRPNHAPGVRGWPSGPASISNSAFSGAIPIRRRSSRSAFATGSPGPARRALPSASPICPGSQAAGTGTSPARNRPRPATAAAAAAFPGAGLLQHGIYQLERHDPGQLAHVTRGEHPGSNRDCPGDGRDSSTDGRLGAQRRSSATGGLGRFPSYWTSVAIYGHDTPEPVIDQPGQPLNSPALRLEGALTDPTTVWLVRRAAS